MLYVYHIKQIMVKRVIFILYTMICLIIYSSAAETTIMGKISGSKSKELIRLLGYKDFLTFEQETLSWAYTGENGEFSITTNINEIKYIQIDVGFQQSDFYLEPGKTYELKISKSNSSQAPGYGAAISLRVTILSPEKNLTASIGKINDTYNTYMMENVRNTHGRFSKAMARELGNILLEKVNETDEPYVINYINYLIASLQLSSLSKTKETLAKEYLSNKPILINNIAYMDFFNAFFSKMLLTSPALINMQNLYLAINNNKTFLPLSDTLKKTGYLDNEDLRKLSILKNLMDLNGFPGFDNKKLISFARQIKEQTKDDRIASVASNVITKLLKNEKVHKAPSFMITSISGKKLNIGEPGKNHSFIGFIDDNLLSVAEVSLLKDIARKYHTHMDFICINAVIDNERFTEQNKQDTSNIIFAHPENLPEILDKYNIIKIPAFVLIDPKGNIQANPAPSPSEDLAGYLRKVMHIY